MVIKKIKLKNFRSFSEQVFNFSAGINLIVGKNASGKTNILEAIYLLTRGHSFRGGRDEDMVAYQTEIASINGRIALPVTGPGRPIEEVLEIVLTRGKVGGIKAPRKKYLVNGVGKRAMDFVGLLRVVIFNPEDLEIVIDSPSIRRDYLDSVLEQTDREYFRASLSYKKGLRQRNKLLEQIRERQRDRSSLFFWDRLLVENGWIISRKREEFIQFINNQPDYFGDLEIEYDRSLISTERLAQYQNEEIAAAMTLVGPHRDEIKFRIKNEKLKMGSVRDLSIYGSRGEQRLAVFSLKMAELEFMAEKTSSRPVLLLDDIFSELDQSNRERLIEVVPKQQTIITTTSAKVIDSKFREGIDRIKLA
ncbi:MAG TPA: DNA replication and repair protein RecF [Candidatus Bathyarchaeia archaeon]|nr:DNA replication and repair protein RecF [Candidatus Bathyarchaeia archaeon]